MNAVVAAITQEGNNPRCLQNGRARDWATFGDSLLKDLVSYRGLNTKDKNVREAMSSRGGIIYVFREVHPHMSWSLDGQWGLPSALAKRQPNLRSSAALVQTCGWTQQANPSNQMLWRQHVNGGATDSRGGSFHSSDKKIVNDSYSSYSSESGVSTKEVETRTQGCEEEVKDVKPDKSSDSPKSNDSDDEQSGADVPKAKAPEVAQSDSAANTIGESDAPAQQEKNDHRRKLDALQAKHVEHIMSIGEAEPSTKKVKCSSAPFGGASCSDVWIVAGDDALHPGFTKAVTAKSEEMGWNLDFVSLPTSMVLHTGTAISQLLFYVDLKAQGMPKQPDLHCVISEGSLKEWPKSSCPTVHQRIDNINHCLRSFGVDGGSTRAVEKERGSAFSGESLLRSSLKTFMILGEGPVGIIDVPTYRERLTNFQETGALTNESLMTELAYGRLNSPHKAKNGVQLWHHRDHEIEDMINHIAHSSGGGSNVTILVLDPEGRSLAL